MSLIGITQEYFFSSSSFFFFNTSSFELSYSLLLCRTVPLGPQRHLHPGAMYAFKIDLG